MTIDLPHSNVLTSRIGRPVRFGAPLDVKGVGGGPKEGKIVDEFWVDPSINLSPPHSKPCNDPHCWGTYSFCSQLIEWKNGERTIRLAYYRRRCGEDWWEFASQMPMANAVLRG